MHTRPFVAAFGLVTLALWPPTADPQTDPQTAMATAETAQHLGHAGSIESLPVAVDGAKNPEKIPMDLAYRHFIRAISGPRDKDGEPVEIKERRRGHLTRMDLSDADKTALVAAMGSLGDDLNRIEFTRRHGAADVDLAALRGEERGLLDATRERIGLAMSAEGVARLEQYVAEHVRKRITIFGELPQ